jgi:hypothetical protein
MRGRHGGDTRTAGAVFMREMSKRACLPTRFSRSHRLDVVAAAVALSALFFATGCTDRRAVLHEGVRFGARNTVTRYSDAEARRASERAERSWRLELERRARQDRSERFANLDHSDLRRRLVALGRKYGFDIVRVRLLRPRQDAPEVVVRTRHYVALARATHSIMEQIDPKRPTGDDRTGWRYEGFYFQADDEHGIPFLAVFNFWRGNGGGGGQWARSDRLFPFDHG